MFLFKWTLYSYLLMIVKEKYCAKKDTSTATFAMLLKNLKRKMTYIYIRTNDYVYDKTNFTHTDSIFQRKPLKAISRCMHGPVELV